MALEGNQFQQLMAAIEPSKEGIEQERRKGLGNGGQLKPPPPESALKLIQYQTVLFQNKIEIL